MCVFVCMCRRFFLLLRCICFSLLRLFFKTSVFFKPSLCNTQFYSYTSFTLIMRISINPQMLYLFSLSLAKEKKIKTQNKNKRNPIIPIIKLQPFCKQRYLSPTNHTYTQTHIHLSLLFGAGGFRHFFLPFSFFSRIFHTENE